MTSNDFLLVIDLLILFIFLIHQYQFNSDGHVPSNRKSYRTNPLGGARHIFGGGGGGATVGEMKPDEFELNHIFLINKRKNVSRDF